MGEIYICSVYMYVMCGFICVLCIIYVNICECVVVCGMYACVWVLLWKQYVFVGYICMWYMAMYVYDIYDVCELHWHAYCMLHMHVIYVWGVCGVCGIVYVCMRHAYGM